MDQLKRLIEIGRQHYEKLILLLVLICLGGAAYYLYAAGIAQRQATEAFLQHRWTGTNNAVVPLELSGYQTATQAMLSAQSLSLSPPHLVLNPVKWQIKPDGTMIKLQRPSDIGPLALKILDIRPLTLNIAVDRKTQSGVYIVVTNQAAIYPNPIRTSQYTSLSFTNTKFFFLKAARPPEDPTEWIVQLRDTGQELTLRLGVTWSEVVDYEADLEYDVESQTFKDVRTGSPLRISGENYNIVAIRPNEVVISADSNDRRYTIEFGGEP